MDDLDATRRSYDTVASRYAEEIAGELAHKPLDRSLLAAFAEEVGAGGRVLDAGCGPGHVTAHLAGLGLAMTGLDLSPAMVDLARGQHPSVDFVAGSMTALPDADGSYAGAIAFYAIIHLDAAQRAVGYRELARVLAPRGLLLVSFHVSSPDHARGDVLTMREWWGHPVELSFGFLDPDEVAAGLISAGFTIAARLDRAPVDGEYPSQRCYLMARRA